VSDNVRISGSVGRRGVNNRDDVMTVQQLINGRLPVPLRPLDVDGLCGPLTINAIEEIQRRFLNMNPPDGRVDVGGATWRWLTTGVAPTFTPHPGAGVFPPDVIALAKATSTKWNIFASVTLAQWAVESAYGRTIPLGSNNPFGIKSWGNDPYVECQTQEVINGQLATVLRRFHKFPSTPAAFGYLGWLLGTRPQYAPARAHLPDDPDGFADALSGVYAGPKNYGTVLKGVMKSYNLYQYDSRL
jgi:hypothetical protein